jgi:hypothetical protein
VSGSNDHDAIIQSAGKSLCRLNGLVNGHHKADFSAGVGCIVDFSIDGVAFFSSVSLHAMKDAEVTSEAQDSCQLRNTPRHGHRSMEGNTNDTCQLVSLSQSMSVIHAASSGRRCLDVCGMPSVCLTIKPAKMSCRENGC